MSSRDRFPGNRSISSCRGAQPHDGTCSSADRPYCPRSKTWKSLRSYVHLCNNAGLSGQFHGRYFAFWLKKHYTHKVCWAYKRTVNVRPYG
ncbi:MAG: hypothetical protein VB125_02310 [Burkholderia sp.]